MVLARDLWNGRGLEGELMLTEDYKRKALKKIERMSNEELKELLKIIGSKPKKDKWIARATHVLQKLEFSGTYIEREDPYSPNSPTWEVHCCPYCGTTEKHKRGNVCELYRLLKEAKENL